jgi:hypothetical protein
VPEGLQQPNSDSQHGESHHLREKGMKCNVKRSELSNRTLDFPISTKNMEEKEVKRQQNSEPHCKIRSGKQDKLTKKVMFRIHTTPLHFLYPQQ